MVIFHSYVGLPEGNHKHVLKKLKWKYMKRPMLGKTGNQENYSGSTQHFNGRQWLSIFVQVCIIEFWMLVFQMPRMIHVSWPLFIITISISIYSPTVHYPIKYLGWLVLYMVGFLSHGRSPSHHGCFNTKPWSSMTWMIWGTPKETSV